MSTDATVDQKCITACRGCGYDDVPLVFPFTSKVERDRWENAHADGAGHTFFFRLDGWPSPYEVKVAMAYQDKLLGRPSAGQS